MASLRDQNNPGLKQNRRYFFSCYSQRKRLMAIRMALIPSFSFLCCLYGFSLVCKAQDGSSRSHSSPEEGEQRKERCRCGSCTHHFYSYPIGLVWITLIYKGCWEMLSLPRTSCAQLKPSIIKDENRCKCST